MFAAKRLHNLSGMLKGEREFANAVHIYFVGLEVGVCSGSGRGALVEWGVEPVIDLFDACITATRAWMRCLR